MAPCDGGLGVGFLGEGGREREHLHRGCQYDQTGRDLSELEQLDYLRLRHLVILILIHLLEQLPGLRH